MNKILLAVMALTSCVYWTGIVQSFTLTKAYFWLFFGGIAVLISLWTTKYEKSGWAWAYLFFCFVASIFAEDKFISFFGVWHRAIGFSSTLLFVVAYATLREKATHKDREFAEILICLVGVAYTLTAFLQYNFPIMPHSYPTNSLAGNTNMTGFVLVLVLPFFLSRMAWFLPFLLVAVVLTNCRAAMGAYAVLLFLWYVQAKHIRIAALIGLIVAIPLLRELPHTNRLTDIWNWEKTDRGIVVAETFRLKGLSFFGIGHGHYRTLFGMHKSKEFEEKTPGVLFDCPHNVLLGHIITYGFPATFILVFLISGVLRRGSRRYRYAVLGYLIVGLASFDTMETLPLFWMIMGVSND